MVLRALYLRFLFLKKDVFEIDRLQAPHEPKMFGNLSRGWIPQS
jgi:hypothetical protein